MQFEILLISLTAGSLAYDCNVNDVCCSLNACVASGDGTAEECAAFYVDGDQGRCEQTGDDPCGQTDSTPGEPVSNVERLQAGIDAPDLTTEVAGGEENAEGAYEGDMMPPCGAGVDALQQPTSGAMIDYLDELGKRVENNDLTEEQLIAEADTADSDSIGQAALRDAKYKWPNAEVPFLIDRKYNKDERKVILSAMNELEAKTCVSFKQKAAGDKNWIYIKEFAPSSCWSMVGRQRGGQQNLALGRRGCMVKGIAIHELMHALGFHHEQSRYDRNKYVTIVKANIQPGKSNNFQSYSSSEITHLGEAYDYGSIMHYHDESFSIDKPADKKTIVPKRPLPTGVRMGQRSGLSEGDVRKINKHYGCGPQGVQKGKVTCADTLPTICKRLSALCDRKSARARFLRNNCRKTCNNCIKKEVNFVLNVFRNML